MQRKQTRVAIAQRQSLSRGLGLEVAGRGSWGVGELVSGAGEREQAWRGEG